MCKETFDPIVPSVLGLCWHLGYMLTIVYL